MTNKKLLVVGAHADDIELNVGGTLVKYHDTGYDIVYIMATNNMAGHWKTIDEQGNLTRRKPPYFELMPQRKLEAANAAQLFGTTPIHLDHPQRHYTNAKGETVQLRYSNPRPDCVPPNTPTILTAHEDEASVQSLADLILKHNPEAVLVHGPIMIDLEHVGTCLLTTKAYNKAVAAGYEGMLLHWLDLTPTLYSQVFAQCETFVDVSEQWDAKLEAVSAHACQLPDVSRLDFQDWSEQTGSPYSEVFTVGAAVLGMDKYGELGREILTNRRI